jgi:hypothetical protein
MLETTWERWATRCGWNPLISMERQMRRGEGDIGRVDVDASNVDKVSKYHHNKRHT